MRALALLACVPVVMWLTQTLLLRRAGLPIRLRIGGSDLPPLIQSAGRVATYAALAAVLLGYPLLRGSSPLVYYAQFLPLQQRRPVELWYGLAAAVLYLSLLYLAWTMTDNVRWEVRHRPGRFVRRLAVAPLAAAFVALLEELLFRAMLLHDLRGSLGPQAGLVLGILLFAGAHYVRRVKRLWTFPGHVALGTLFCLAFVRTEALWLPLGLHAGGVWVLLTVRPFVRYGGPAWLVGASIYPYAGVAGIAALVLLSINIWLLGIATP